MINIALVFDEDMNRQVVQTAARYDRADAASLMGINNLPHITLTQIDLAPEDAVAIYEKVQEHLPTSFELRLDYFNVSDRNPSKISFDYAIQGDDALFNAPHIIRDLFPDVKIVNAIGDDYYPHLTLGCYTNLPKPAELENSIPQAFTGRLAICSRESYGRVERILYAPELIKGA